jgi:hydrogenase 3 maturation protease
MSASLTAEVCAALRRQPGINVLMVIGNSLRQDDGVGPFIAACLQAADLGASPLNGRSWQVIDAGSEPEDYFDEIIARRPDYLLIIDAAHFGGYAGEARLIGKSEVSDYTLSTHVFPLRALWELVEQEIPVAIRLIGIQPVRCELGEGLSAAVRRTADRLVAELSRPQ